MTEIKEDEKLNAFLDKLHADLERKKLEQIELWKEVERLLARIAENKAKCKQLEQVIDVTIPEKLKLLEDEKAFNLAIVAALDQKLAILAEELRVLNGEKQVLVGKSDVVQSKINEVEAEINQMEKQIDDVYAGEEVVQQDLSVGEEINRQFAMRDEIRSRLRPLEEDLRKDRAAYSTVINSFSDIEKVIPINDRKIFKARQTIDLLEAEVALEQTVIESLNISSKTYAEEINEMETKYKQEISNEAQLKELLIKQVEDFEFEKQKKMDEKKKEEDHQSQLDPVIQNLENEELENFSSVFTVENNLQATNSVFDNFFGSLFTFIVTPSRFSAVGHFSGISGLNEKRTVLKNQLSALRQGISTNQQLISNEKNKSKEFRDKAFKLRAEITLISSKIEKSRNLQFMINKPEDVVQDAIDEKHRIINQAKSVVEAKESENAKRKAIIAETRDTLQKLQKENDLKKSEIDSLRNNQEILQDKIIKEAILYEKATDEWNMLAKEINERIGKSNQVQTELGDLDKKLRSLYRIRRENLKEKESLDLQIATYAEFIKVKQGEERPILNEKKLTLQIIDDIEAAMSRQHRECKILIRVKLETEQDTQRLNVDLEDVYDRIEINKLTIKSKEEMIELNQPLIPNITCNTRFY